MPLLEQPPFGKLRPPSHRFAGRGMDNSFLRLGPSLGETRPRGRVSPRRAPQPRVASSAVRILGLLLPVLTVLSGCAHWGGSAVPTGFPAVAVLSNPMAVGP